MKFACFFIIFALSAILHITHCTRSSDNTNTLRVASNTSGYSDASCTGHPVQQAEVSTVEADEDISVYLQKGLFTSREGTVFNQLGAQSVLEHKRGSPPTVSGNMGRQKKPLIEQVIYSGLLASVFLAISCTVLGYIVYPYDWQAFTNETSPDAALFCVSLAHFFSVLCSSIMVPASYEVMGELQAPAVVSGMYVGIYNCCWGILANVLVYLLMLQFPQLWRTGSQWLLWSGVAFQVAGILVYNLILLALDASSQLPQALLQISAVSTRALMGIGAGIISYVWRFLIVHLVPADKRPQANMLIPFVTMVGNGLGPLVLAVAQFGSQSEHMFLCNGAPLFLFVPLLASLTALFPALEEVEDQKVEIDKSADPIEGAPTTAAPLTPENPAPVPAGAQPKDRSVRELLGGCRAGCESTLSTDIPLSQKVLLGGCVVFSSLWGVTFGGLEVAMVQILTDEFGLSLAVASILIGCSILAVVPLKLLFNRRSLHITSWIHLLMGTSLLGTFMLLNLHQFFTSKVPQIVVLLMADILIFPAFSFAWGLCDGIALRYAASRGWFAASNLILVSQIGFCSTRLLGSMLSRWVLTVAGRSMYALQQILITLMAWLITAGLILPHINEKAVDAMQTSVPFARQSSHKSPSLD